MLMLPRGRKVGPAIFDRRNAELTTGLVGYWSPVLTGPTGLQLLDLSGQNNHGTLTNMDAPTDWVEDVYGRVLDFDGSNDLVQFPRVLNFGKVHTFNCWMKTSDASYILSGHVSTSNWYAFLQDSGLFYYNAGGSFVSVPGTANNSAWRMITVVRSETSVSFFRDSLQVGTTQTLSTSNDLLIEAIGGYNNATVLFAGQIAEQSFHNRDLRLAVVQSLYRLGPGGLGRRLRDNFFPLTTAIAYSMTADSATYALTGQPAGLIAGRMLTADQANYLLQGNAAGLQAARMIQAEPASYTLTGLDAGTLLGRLLDAGSAAYALTPSSTGLLTARQITAETAAYLAIANATDLRADRRLTADHGQFILVASDINITTGSGGVAPYYYLFLLGGSR